MLEHEMKAFAELPDEFLVYRGYTKNQNGCSYSLSELTAMEYATIDDIPGGKIIKRRIKKSDAFAYIDRGGESEIIVVEPLTAEAPYEIRCLGM